MKALATVISMIALIGSSLACGQGDNRAAVPRDNLDRVVPRLPSGLSIEEVEGQLGEPAAKFEVEGGEMLLNYQPWELIFYPSLYKRTRNYVAGFRPDQPVALLDFQVRALELGSSRRTVERELGRTEAWQVMTLGHNERLWYGNGRWKLVFKDRRLSGRVLFS